jgi:hypothetical protein
MTPTSALAPEDLDALLAAYAIDALDADERVLVDAYLKSHPEAQQDVFAYRRAAARLCSTDGPSPHVWDRIATQIQTSDPVARVVDLDERRRHPYRLTKLIAVAAAITSIAGTAVALSGSDHAPTRSAVTPSAQLRQAADAALTTTGAQHGAVHSANGPATVALVLLPSGAGYVLAATAMDTKQGYRLIAVTAAGPVIIALIDRRPPIAFQLPPNTTAILLETVADLRALGDQLVPPLTPVGGTPTTAVPLPTTAGNGAPFSVPGTSLPAITLPAITLPPAPPTTVTIVTTPTTSSITLPEG